MAKKINLITAFNWFSTLTDTQDLTASEKIIIMEIMKHLNRNFWTPLKISNQSLARATGKDPRTTKNALKKLIEKNIIINTKEGYSLGCDRFNTPVGSVTAERDATDRPTEQNNPAETAGNAPDSTEQPAKVKSLAEYL